MANEQQNQLLVSWEKLAIVFNTLTTMPVENMSEFVEKYIYSLAGVTQCEILLHNMTKPSQTALQSSYLGEVNFTRDFDKKVFDEMANRITTERLIIYPIYFGDAFYGCITVELNNQETADSIDPIINNLSVFLSVTLSRLETQEQLIETNSRLNRHKKNLEKQVDERTKSLQYAKDEIQKTLTKTIEALAFTVEQHDPYTAGHQYRVAVMSKALASRLGLDDEQIDNIYLGALIHDIGKVQVPTEILTTPAQLSDLQFELIKTHPAAGDKIVRTIPLNETIMDIVLHHHERLDGSGYPDGLVSSEIFHATKIVAVADVFEAMSSHRPYRPGVPVPDTLKHLNEHADQLYDSAVVECCEELINGGFELPLPNHQLAQNTFRKQ